MINKLNNYEQEKIARYIGDIYRCSKMRKEFFEERNCILENQKIYENDCKIVLYIEQSIVTCRKETKMIIEI